MEIKAGVAQGKEVVRPFRAQELFVDEKPKNLAGEELG